MPAYFITGSPGAGKSTTLRALADRGYAAYDTDSMPGVSQLELRASGEPVTNWPPEPIDWDLYAWNWQPAAIAKLLAADGTVFLGGVVSNQGDFYNRFAAIFVLTISTDTLRHRILSRTEKDYGKEPNELAGLLAYHAKRESSLLAAPQAVAIDASRPVDKVIEDILHHVKNHD